MSSGHEKATPRPWHTARNGLNVRLYAEKQLICALSPYVSPVANAALIVEAVNSYDTLRAERDSLAEENERLRAAIKAILDAETHLLHDGYDDGPGGGNYVYVDVIRTDDEAFALALAALADRQP